MHGKTPPNIIRMSAISKARAQRDCLASATFIGDEKFRECLGTNVIGCWNGPPLTDGWGYCLVEMYLAIHANPGYFQICEALMWYQQVGATLHRSKYEWTCVTKV